MYRVRQPCNSRRAVTISFNPTQKRAHVATNVKQKNSQSIRITTVP